ncbi:methyltransferase domain-containing protein [Roseiterribacter gracilis]|uniref:SAM-dependent methyltransferase n=1 Tax=Roseiterribacter gracilis TaxID=2812848 RepID=A0A8S8XGW8_9PROT|nr:SAM-dependent methyltransferase [Rhodospirillales bacterium TMPK1]
MSSIDKSPTGTVQENMRVFDRRLVRQRRARAWPGLVDPRLQNDFLLQHAAQNIADRIVDTTRRFPRALVLGRRGTALESALRATGRIDTLVVADLIADSAPDFVADEEALPFADQRFDLVVSNLALHWVNDLPGALLQIRRCLVPDGLFLASMLGGTTLHELRQALLAAELSLRGGAAQRVSPFADIRDAAGLLQRAGFALPVADREVVPVLYREPMRLFSDLRGMGETAALAETAPPLTRGVLIDAIQRWQRAHSDEEGRTRATFELLHLTGWAPAASQPQPLKRGSATTRLADALGVPEHKA